MERGYLTNASNLTPQAGRFFAKHTAQKSVQLATQFMRALSQSIRLGDCMETRSTHLIELAKYPVLVLSIVLALIILKYSLDLEFGMITEVSTDGLKFSKKSNKAALEAITELELKLNDLSVRLSSIENKDTSDSSVEQIKAETFFASQEVSDATATIAKLSPPIQGTKSETLIGWMWVGNYDNEWIKTPFARIDTGQPLEVGPVRMQAGTEYKVLGNMVIRDGLPPNDEDYYRARKSLGIVPRGSIVRLLDSPKGIDREFAVQYWAKIEYIKEN